VFISILIALLISFLIILLYYFKQHKSSETLDISFSGFSYDPETDTFYSEKDAWQREYGYCKLYDDIALISGMVIDSEPIKFEYDGKRWLIEFWKGQYGMTAGAEVGIYNSSEKYSKDMLYHSANDNEMLPMTFHLMKKNSSFIFRADKHWWLTGFKLGEFAKPKHLSMYITISFPDTEMCNAFINALRKLKYSNNEFLIEGNTVKIAFTKPHSKQPFTRNPICDFIILNRNKRLCKIYQKLIGNSSDMSYNLLTIKQRNPNLYKKLYKIGKSDKLFGAKR